MSILTPGWAMLLSAAALWSQPQEAEIRAHLELAARAKQKGELQSAAKEYGRALELDPSQAETHARLGMIYQDLGLLPKATESLERALKLNPHLPRVNVLLAFNYIGLGRYRDAIPSLAASFDTERDLPFRVLIGQRLVECYFATGDEQNGLALTQKLQLLAPDDPDVLYTASKVYANLWNRTVQHLLAQAPESYRVHQLFAEVLETQEKFTKAANEYRQILKTAPQAPGMHYRLGRMILRSNPGDDGDQKALAEFLLELENNPADVPSLAEIAEIQLRNNRLAEAERNFSRALELQPGYVQAHIGLAKALIAQKELPRALEQLEVASKLAPADETIPYHRMIVYRGLGRSADAKLAFDTFQRLKQKREQSRSAILNHLRVAPLAGPSQ